MKKFTTFIVIFLLSITALFAQVPEKLTYQAVVRNASNSLVINAQVGVRVSILQGGVNGTLVYMETQTAVTNANGLITLQIGGGNVQQGNFADIDWASGSYFLKTETDPDGGSNYSVTSTQQLLSVPYALYAKEAANGFSGDYNDLTNTPQIPTVPTNVSAFTNDAGYLTNFTEQQVLSISHDTLFLTGGSFVKLPAGFDGDYNSLTNKPELFSGDYNDLTNQPTIPTVPTNVSAFTNDAGYITMDSIPTIPTVPTNVSVFNNDAGYITEASCNGMNICESLAALQSQVDSLQQSSLLPETQAQLPIVVTTVVSDSAATSATCGGNVTSDGGSVVSAKGVCWNTTGNPTISGNHTLDGGGMGAFESILHGLAVGTTYYVRAYATNSGGTSYSDQITFNFQGGYQTWDGTGLNPNDAFACQGIPMVTDHEGNVYNTVKIGQQCWTKENLRTTTSPSTGTYLIPASGTGYTYTGKQARWYNNDSATYAPMNYGLLYNWNAAVDTFNTAYGETSVNTSSSNAVSVTFNGHRRGICPAGWHLPSDAEWTQLTDYVSSQSEYTCSGNSNNIAKALASTEGWNTHTNNCAVGNDPSLNNATGFSAVPAGYCRGSSFYRAGYYAYFWSATQYASSPYNAYYRYLTYDNAGVRRDSNDKYNGRSVRCLRD